MVLYQDQEMPFFLLRPYFAGMELWIFALFILCAGPGGKKNRQKERRLMKGYNMSNSTTSTSTTNTTTNNNNNNGTGPCVTFSTFPGHGDTQSNHVTRDSPDTRRENNAKKRGTVDYFCQTKTLFLENKTLEEHWIQSRQRWMHHYLLAPGHSNIIVKLIIEVEFPNLFGRKYTGRLGSSNRLSFS